MRFVGKSSFTVSVGVVLALAFMVLNVSSANAADLPNQATNHGITISPTQKELVVSSGLVVANTTVTLTNHTGKSLVGTIKVLDFKTLNETSGLVFSQAGVSTEKYGLANWMSLPNGDTINVSDGQTATIPVRVVNRADLAPGGHYGAVVVTLSTGGAPKVSQASFKQELVSLLLVKKLGGEDYGLSLESMKLDSVYNIPDATYLEFKSTGNTHVVPRGYVSVSDHKGTVVAKGIINPESRFILPGTSRQMVTLLQPVAHKRTSGQLKVTAYYRYDEEVNYRTQTISLRYVNESIKFAIVFVLVGVVLIIVSPRSRRRLAKIRRK